jgi:hypothetical protein
VIASGNHLLTQVKDNQPSAAAASATETKRGRLTDGEVM